MAEPKAKEWPKSPIETLDQELAVRIGRLSDGTATAQDASEATRLIRERADYMMPGIFRRLRAQRAARRAG
jgi:hypothetical protein